MAEHDLDLVSGSQPCHSIASPHAAWRKVSSFLQHDHCYKSRCQIMLNGSKMAEPQSYKQGGEGGMGQHLSDASRMLGTWHVISCNPHNPATQLLFPLYSSGNWGSGRLNNLLEVTQDEQSQYSNLGLYGPKPGLCLALFMLPTIWRFGNSMTSELFTLPLDIWSCRDKASIIHDHGLFPLWLPRP